MNGKFAKNRNFSTLETFRPKHIYVMFSNKCVQVYFFDKYKVPPCFLKEKQIDQLVPPYLVIHSYSFNRIS